MSWLEYIILPFTILMNLWGLYNGVLAIAGITNYSRAPTAFYPKRISFSIIIPAKNEERTIGRLLKLLEEQEYPEDLREIIVVEDGSTDSTLAICKSFPKVLCIHRDNSNGKPSALNYALTFAKKDVIAILDADTIIERDFLYKASKFFSDNELMALQCSLRPANANLNLISKLASIEELLYEYIVAGKSRLNLLVTSHGTAFFIRREALNILNGWKEDALAEDAELSMRLRKLNMKIVYTTYIKAWREVPSGILVLFKQRLRWYYGYLQVAISNKNLLESIIFWSPAINALWLIIYPITLVYITLFTLNNIIFILLFISVFTIIINLFNITYITIKNSMGLHTVPLTYLYWNISTLIQGIALLNLLTGKKMSWERTLKSGIYLNKN